ncbi:MAG: hypothetical protein HYX72_05475 [Acidobacteria bacterium]|nr:hypothetical protein [Acidobacteriota bacterium]
MYTLFLIADANSGRLTVTFIIQLAQRFLATRCQRVAELSEWTAAVIYALSDRMARRAIHRRLYVWQLRRRKSVAQSTVRTEQRVQHPAQFECRESKRNPQWGDAVWLESPVQKVRATVKLTECIHPTWWA